MRDLLRLAVAPDIVSRAGGLQARELLPTAELRACLDGVIERDGARALQYSPPWEPLKEWIAGDMHPRFVACGPGGPRNCVPAWTGSSNATGPGRCSTALPGNLSRSGSPGTCTGGPSLAIR